MFLMAEKILKIAIESKVTIPSSSLATEENHLRFYVKKKKSKNIDGSKFDLTLESSYI